MANDADNQILMKKKKMDNKRKRFNNEDSDNELKISVNEEMKVKKRKKHKDGPPTKRSKSDEGDELISEVLESPTSRKDSNGKRKFKHVKRSQENIDVEEESTSDEHHVLKKKKKNKLISNNEVDFSSVDESVVVNKEIKARKLKKHEHESPKQKSRKHKDSQNVAEDEKLESTNSESSTIGQDNKNHKMSYIPNQVLDELLLKCDQIVKDSKSPTVKHDLNKHKRVVSKSVKGSHIQNEILDYLLLKCDKIVEEDENRKTSMNGNQHSVKRNEEINHAQEFSQKKMESNDEDEEDLNDDADKLRKIQFVLPFGLPDIHKIAYLPCTRPTPEQRIDLENAGIELKLGKFTKEEDEKILKNWKHFCQTHDWDEKNYMPFLKGSKKSKKGILTKKKVEKFVQFISHNFEDRLMFYIYLRFQRLFSINENKKFTPEEDEMIRSYVKNFNRPYAELSFLLKRSRDALQKRYKRLQNQTEFDNVKIFWNKDRTKQLLKSIMKVTGCKTVEDLKTREITEKEWKQISKKMALPEQKIKGVWLREVYTRIFTPNFGEKSAEILEKLINKMSKKYNDWRDIDWHEEAKEYDSFTHQRLYKMFADLVRTKVPKEEQKNFKACIKHLKQSSIEPKKLRFTYIQEILAEIEAI